MEGEAFFASSFTIEYNAFSSMILKGKNKKKGSPLFHLFLLEGKT